MLLFEGGKSLDINDMITDEGYQGAKRFLKHLDMLNPKREVKIPSKKTIYIEKSTWIRANFSGLFHGMVKTGSFVKKGEVLAMISDPFGKVEHKLKAQNEGYIINANDAPIVYQGDAVFHISTQLENKS